MSRAVIQETFGGPEVVEVRAVAESQAGPGEVRPILGWSPSRITVRNYFFSGRGLAPDPLHAGSGGRTVRGELGDKAAFGPADHRPAMAECTAGQAGHNVVRCACVLQPPIRRVSSVAVA